MAIAFTDIHTFKKKEKLGVILWQAIEKLEEKLSYVRKSQATIHHQPIEQQRCTLATRADEALLVSQLVLLHEMHQRTLGGADERIVIARCLNLLMQEMDPHPNEMWFTIENQAAVFRKFISSPVGADLKHVILDLAEGSS